MYVREEKIEEENLDWGELTKASQENQEKLIEEAKHEAAGQSVPESNKSFLKQSAAIKKIAPKFTLKDELTHFLKHNAEISLLFGMVFIPYILGFLISYFLFFFYGGMPISHFLDVQKVPTTIELWSIGAYLFVSVGAVLAFLVP
ncbi:MAG TPA: hypothetical protein VIM88_02410 [Sulfurovum sp.]|uniref:hypothetical protein n=1 Tax=Sulfurovum sp. TaxID=1969726 RepID=UPI002F93DF2A